MIMQCLWVVGIILLVSRVLHVYHNKIKKFLSYVFIGVTCITHDYNLCITSRYFVL